MICAALTLAITRGGRQISVALHLFPDGARRRLRGVVSAHLEADHRPSACGPVRRTTEFPLTPRASTKMVWHPLFSNLGITEHHTRHLHLICAALDSMTSVESGG